MLVRQASWTCTLLAQIVAAVALPAIRLSGLSPSSGLWVRGPTIVKGGEWMVEQVNDNPALLPDYSLEILWQDGGCDSLVGQRALYANWFENLYHLLNGSTVSGIKTVGLIGPDCSPTSVAQAALAYWIHMPMISASSVFPSLSDRSRYPGFWRTMLPDTRLEEAFVATVRSLGFNEVAVIVGEENAASSLPKLLETVDKFDVELLGPSMFLVPNANGWLLRQDSAEEGAREIVEELVDLRPSPPRFVILLLRDRRAARAVLCAAFHRGLSSQITFMTYGWLTPLWWRDLPPGYHCTEQDMDVAVNKTISTQAVQKRSDLGTRLSCSASATAADFFADMGDALEEAASSADAVCTYAKMLHELIYTHGNTLAELEDSSDDIYSQAQQILEATDFEGTQGRMQFLPGLPDPNGAVEIQQIQISNFNTQMQKTLLARYAAGAFSWLGVEMWFPGGKLAVASGPSLVNSTDFDFGATGPLLEFVTCSYNTTFDLTSNSCKPCPLAQIYNSTLEKCVCMPDVQQEGISACDCAPGMFMSLVQCVLESNRQSCYFSCAQCQPGKFTNSAGAKTCSQCQAGTSSNSNRSTGCSSCPVGSFSGEDGMSSCKQCPAGHYQLARGRTECMACAPGSFADTSGSSSCKTCHDQAFSSQGGAEACERCDGLFMRVNQARSSCSLGGMLFAAVAGAGVLLGLSISEVLTKFRLQRSEGLWSLSSETHFVDNIETDDLQTVVTFPWHHGWQNRGRKSFPISFAGTGHYILDSSRPFHAQVSGTRTLLLFERDGSVLPKSFQSSMGSAALPFGHALLHAGWPFPLIVQMPLMLVIAASLMLISEPHFDESAVALAIPLFVVILLLACKRKNRHHHRRRLDKAIEDFCKKLGHGDGSIAVDPGPGRAIMLKKLLGFAQHFADFTRDRNMYYVEPNIVRQLTAPYKTSLAEFLGASRLNWFVSHWWGNNFQDTMNALKQHAIYGKTAEDWSGVSYWICTFSNNQHKLKEEIPGRLEDSSFFKALHSGFCEGVCMILDERAEPLTRSWCLFEFLQTVQLSEKMKDFQGLIFCHTSGVLDYGTASVAVALGICKRLSNMRLEDASASTQSDKEMIDALVISQLGSFANFDSKLRKEIIVALDAAKLTYEREFQALASAEANSGPGAILESL
ncbi:unnamed protein product [Polarella glacialis]|uniref:Receptor ligand binding region domain-containing protein n=1 Tax=Polarella glacialis TaxID=89957 RepID=A0A813JU95_POLGL|nr:unnamed protein product [Polarella glacialis]